MIITLTFLVSISAVGAFQVPSHRPLGTAARAPIRSAFSSSTSTPLSATPRYDETCDVLVLGSGPAARSIASLLSAEKLNVLMSDQNLDREWPPNYGVWKDEWEAIVQRYNDVGVSLDTSGHSNLHNSIDREWSVTDCYFGGSFGIPTQERMRVDRPYCRVDKLSLQQALTENVPYRTIKANHVSEAINVNMYKPAGSLMHDEKGTTIRLLTQDERILTVRSKLIVDCTGHETKLVLRESREGTQNSPGFQIAYGVLVEVDESDLNDTTHIGPYDKKAMTLFDYRTDHFDEETKAAAAPTFMYAMPLKKNQIFFEETSLVARPAVSFQECKERCIQRLEHHDIRVTAVHEEEFCYIPMGGALPARDQRILALGGAAAMVHPSTGYHLCRCMMAAADMAAVIREELAQEAPNLDRAAAAAYHAVWTPENIRQRNFAVFGGEYLMKQSVVGLRGFFDGFFRLPLPLWGGFLAGWPGLPNNDKHESWYARMWFGLNFVARLPLQVGLDMLYNIIEYIVLEGVPLAQSVTPFLGKPLSYEYHPNQDGVGDVAAKQEARQMIRTSKVTEGLPVAFDESAGTEQVMEGQWSMDGSDFPMYRAGSRSRDEQPKQNANEKNKNVYVVREPNFDMTPVKEQSMNAAAKEEKKAAVRMNAVEAVIVETEPAVETDEKVVANGDHDAHKDKQDHDFDDVRRKNLKSPKGDKTKGFGSS